MILISGHHRYGYKHSTPLYHQVSTGFYGKVKDMEHSLAETKRLQKKIEEYNMKDKISEFAKIAKHCDILSGHVKKIEKFLAVYSFL